ncbi:MAG: hypothetical protein H7Y43_05635, partial [Akkermansiaceae bacterium]|nr:hypothetical protein [Verrucomicrobiales bacterium]
MKKHLLQFATAKIILPITLALLALQPTAHAANFVLLGSDGLLASGFIHATNWSSG